MSMKYEMPSISENSRYTIGATAKALGMHRNTIRKYCDCGILKFSYRMGTRKLIEGREIIRLWKECHRRRFGVPNLEA